MRVCILGSGLSALTLAKSLVNENIYVDILSLKKKFEINRSRTLGISKNNFEYFNSKIINIEKISWQLNKIEIFTDNLKYEKILNFENDNEQLFSVIKNYHLYELLNKSLSKNAYFKKIEFKTKLPDLEKYSLIINTDYFSTLTKKFFNKKIEKKYNSSACTTIIEHEEVDNKVAVQIFTKKGPLAFLPVSKNETSVVYSIHNLKNNNQDNIKNLIKEYNWKYKIKKIERIEFFELKSLNLRSYYYKNILAFGDLLHRIHPLAGQGFNMTIRDIKILINVIKEKNDLGLPLDIAVNYEFEKKSKHKNYIFSNGIDLVQEFFNLERKFNNRAFAKTVKFLGKNQSLNKMFTKIADIGLI